MDSGYEGEDVLRWNEQHGIDYVTKMTRKGNLWSLLLSTPKTEYRKAETEAGQIETISFLYQRGTWSKARRVVVVRWNDEVDRTQSNLFDALGYNYMIFITNLNWDEEDIYRFYDSRGDMENHIREAKYDFFIGHISTSHFHANAADLELRLLAMNQLILFARHVLGQKNARPFASTLRRRWLMIPAKLVRSARRWILKLSDRCHYRKQWSLYRINLGLT